MPKRKGGTEPPFSKKQQRWAWSAEAEGKLKKGTAKKWANRMKHRPKKKM
jgi:hypothetical protein